MAVNFDLMQIQKTYTSIKQDILHSKSDTSLLDLKAVKNQLNIRESQLRTVIEISEQLIFYTYSLHQSAEQIPDELNSQNLKIKCLAFERQLKNSEKELQDTKSELGIIKNKLESLNNNSDTQLFTVEVYKSEIEELKRENNMKVNELSSIFYLGQLKKLQSCRLQSQYLELSRKYMKAKEQITTMRTKIVEFEEILVLNEEQTKITEAKYNSLVKTHKEMFGYIEKLEEKVKVFQDRCKREYLNYYSPSKNTSLSISNYEYKPCSLSIDGPSIVL
jgi:chromosome segregation ATPase